MPLPDRFIEDLTMRNRIEEVASSYVNLRQRGRNFVGLCPFHGEKTPSFTIYPENNSFYCFGCGAGGDIITFVKKIEHLDYLDAVRFLADRAGLEMPRLEIDDTVSKLRRRCLEANREAARFYYELLYSPAGKEGLDYYHSRGYTDRTIKHFGLGFAPNGFHALLDHLRKKGFHDEELLSAGLCRRSQKGHLYDFFRYRVIVPIIDVRGNVIAFGGRVLDDSKPKYLNTGDTPVFKKTNNLFALNFAKEGERTLILCEGYMDVIAMHQAGFTNTVAALGTSFTEDHARLMARYADDVFLLFDSDAAGQQGLARAVDKLRTTGLRTRVVRIPDGKDADEYLRKHPPGDLKLLIERSPGDVEYQLSAIRARHTLTTTDGKFAYIQEAVKLIATLSNPIEQDLYAGRLAQETDVSKSVILQQLDSMKRRRKKRAEREVLPQELKKERQETQRINPEALQYPEAAAAEEALIGLLLMHPDYIEAAARELPAEDMLTSLNRKIYALLIERKQAGLLVELSLLAVSFEDDQMAYITRIWNKAGTLGGSEDDMQRYIRVIREQGSLSKINLNGDGSDDDMRRAMEALRKIKT
ncbi:MAG: DNA primase [Clostridia bacterium]|nr:DNA primase [Clostridia bacterium]